MEIMNDDAPPPPPPSGHGLRAMNGRRIPGLAAVVAAVALAGCGGGGGNQRTAAQATGNAAATVAVEDMSFAPGDVTVGAGQAVAWKWDGRAVHDVAFDGGPASPKQTRGSWERTFADAGTYRYVCTLHPGMKGTVTVS